MIPPSQQDHPITRPFAALAAILAVIAAPADAANVFDNQASYLAAAPGDASFGIPPLGFLPSFADAVYDGGRVSIDAFPGTTRISVGEAGAPIADWSTLLPDPTIAFSGVESFDLFLDTPARGISFLIHEPTLSRPPAQSGAPDSCNGPCVDSTFLAQIFADGDLIDGFVIEPEDDAVTFVGITSALPFDQLRVVETIGTGDNEYFGAFTVASIPLPATAPLLLAGLGGTAVFGRRRRRVSRAASSS